ncbi:MAG: bifunctional lysylphosphatidylglycerol flippase/synthetase MprF [Gemmatimonadota bacterium]
MTSTRETRPALDLPPGEASPAEVRAVLQRYGSNADSFQAGLSYHRRLFFADAGVVACARVGRVTVVAGDPVAAPGRLLPLVEALRAALPGPIAVVSASEQVRDELAADGWGWVKVGEEPYWEPGRWSLEGKAAANVRHAVNAARRKELRVEETGPGQPSWDGDLAAMRAVAEAWSGTHETRPLGFLLTLAPFERPEDRRYFVAREPSGRIVAFLAAVPIWARDGWYFQDFVRLPDAPAGVNELLFHEAMLAMRAVGARLVTLGAAPLAGLDKEEPQRPWIHRVLRFAYEHLDAFYHFQTLSGYKAKYAPHWWEPKYLVFHPRRLRARLLFAVLKAYDPRGATRLVLSRLAEGLREELAIDPDTGRPRVVGHALRLPGLLLQQDLLVAVALALAIGSGIGIVADHLRRSFDDVYVATLSSLIAASLTVALLRARDRHEAHP